MSCPQPILQCDIRSTFSFRTIGSKLPDLVQQLRTQIPAHMDWNAMFALICADQERKSPTKLSIRL